MVEGRKQSAPLRKEASLTEEVELKSAWGYGESNRWK